MFTLLLYLKGRTSLLRILFATLLVAGNAHALSTDKQRDIEIEADTAELDYRNGVVVYRGNVLVTQGSLSMTGDTMTVTFNEQDEMDTVIIKGSPATYRQLPDGSEIYDEAKALQMEYRALEDYVILLDEVLIMQQGLHFSGNRIEYDTVKNKVKATGNAETGTSGEPGKPSDGNERVKITIKKNALKQK